MGLGKGGIATHLRSVCRSTQWRVVLLAYFPLRLLGAKPYNEEPDKPDIEARREIKIHPRLKGVEFSLLPLILNSLISDIGILLINSPIA